MKLFKKALLATAIFGAMGAQAATVSSDPVKLSSEGVAAGLFADDVALDIDFVVKKLTPAASVVTLTFDDAVDLSVLEAAATAGTAGYTTDTSAGKSYLYTEEGTNPGFQSGEDTVLLTFDYGTGSFTFDRLEVDADEGTVVFEVNLGNPVTAQSAFRLSSTADAGIDISGASTVDYSSEESDGTSIEVGTGTIATIASQFDFGVSSPFNGRIDRVAQKTFTENGEATVGGTSVATHDTLGYYLIDNASNLEAALGITSVEIKLEGNFDNGGASGAETEDATFTPAASFSANDTSLTFTNAATITTDGKKSPGSLIFNNSTTPVVVPQTKGITAKATFTVSAGDPIVVASGVDAGEWALDALVVNVPYLPVGFDGLNTSVHFANESANKAEVLVTAIDQKGEEYSGAMADLAGNTVTKYSQVAIMDALKAPAGSKLSVTFNINANEGDVKAYAFSNAGTGRQALVTSQQDGK